MCSTCCSTASTITLRTLLCLHVYILPDKVVGHALRTCSFRMHCIQSVLSSYQTLRLAGVGKRSLSWPVQKWDAERFHLPQYIPRHAALFNTFPSCPSSLLWLPYSCSQPLFLLCLSYFLCNQPSTFLVCWRGPPLVSCPSKPLTAWPPLGSCPSKPLTACLGSTNHLCVLQSWLSLLNCWASCPLPAWSDLWLCVLNHWALWISESHKWPCLGYLDFFDKRLDWNCQLCLAAVDSNVWQAIWNSKPFLHMLVDLPFHCLYMAHCYLIYTVSGHIIRGMRPYCKHHNFNFPGRPLRWIDLRPSLTCFAVSWTLPVSFKFSVYQRPRLFTGCSCIVGISSPHRVKWKLVNFPRLRTRLSRLLRLKLHPAPIHELLKFTQDCLNCLSAWI